MHRFRLFAALLCALLLGSALLGAAPPTYAQARAWTQVSGVPPTVTLNDVLVLDMRTAWAVGQDGADGVIYRLTRAAGRWEVSIDARLAAPLRAIAAGAPGDLWVVGDGGMFHRDTTGWMAVPLPIEARLNSIKLLDGGATGWAGGSTGPEPRDQRRQLVLRHQGGAWQVDPSFAGMGEIRGLDFASPENGWAIGETTTDRTGIWRYHSGRWSSESDLAACDAGCLRNLSRVRAIDGETAWAAGTSIGLCAICIDSHDYLIQRGDGGWRDGLPYEVLAPFYPNGQMPPSLSLGGLAFAGRDDGLAVGGRTARSPADGPPGLRPQVLRYHDGAWSIDPVPLAIGQLNAVGMAGVDDALAVGSQGLILSYGDAGAAAPLPTARVEDPRDPAASYFAETGHTLRGRLREYWAQHGGLTQFGYPLTEEFVEQSTIGGHGFVVQYFERARFEYHPENQPPYDVLLGLLGRSVTAGRADDPGFQPVAEDGSGRVYFAATGHHLAPEFVAYWQAHGGLAIFGYPISEPLQEEHDGRTYQVQYFERARFEYHPENRGTPYEVLLGRLGAQLMGLL